MSNGNTNNQSLGKALALPIYNTYSFINNSAFYALVGGSVYQNYYLRVIRQAFQLYDGFYPELHKQENGIFSTRMCKAIMNKLASQINGGTMMFDYSGDVSEETIRDKTAKEFIEDWSKKYNFSNQMNTTTEWALVGGDSLISLSYDGSNFIPRKHRKDTYLIDTDFVGEITNVKILQYTFTNTTQSDENKTSYYLLEERKFNKKGKPVITYSVKVTAGVSNNNRGSDINPARTINFKDLPKSVRNRLIKNFPEIKLGVEQEMPFDDNLGVYLVKASESVTNIPDLPFGESEVSKIFSQLMSWDYYYSIMNTDWYLGRGRVIMPKPFQSPVGQEYSNYNQGLDSQLYQWVSGNNNEGQKPFSLQFGLRTADWKGVKEILTEMMATNLNISVRTIVEVINNSSNVTAREISTEEDATILFVENKRSLIKNTLDKMIDDLLKLNGYNEDTVVVRYSKAGLTNVSNVVTQVTTLKQAGLIDDMTALKMIFVDKDDKQLEMMLESINKAKEVEVKKQEIVDEKTIEEKTAEENNNDISHIKKS